MLVFLSLLAFSEASCSTYKKCGPCTQARCKWAVGVCSATCPMDTACIATDARCPKPTATPMPNNPSPTPPNSLPKPGTGVSLGRSIRMLEIVGKPVSVDVRPAFNASGAKLTFTATGLPRGSGMIFSEGGVLTGSPKAADLAAPQPIVIAISATAQNNPKLQGSIYLLVSVLGAEPKADKTVAFFTYAGLFIAPVNVRQELNLKGSPTYAVSGLPVGTGLALNASLGLLGGAPTEADLRSKQPMVALIKATIGQKTSTLAVVVTVVPYDPIAELQLPPPEVVPNYQIYVGVQGVEMFDAYQGATAGWCAEKCTKSNRCLGFNFDPTSSICGLLSGVTKTAPSDTNYIYVRLLPAEIVLVSLNYQGVPFTFNFSATVASKNPVRYSVAGLPRASALSMSNMGIFSGTPNAIDAAARQPLVLTLVANDPKTKVNASVLLILTIAKTKPTGSVTATLGTVGQTLSFPLTQFFPEPVSQWTFSLSGAPQGSKLAIDKGVLSGPLTETEFTPSQPLYLVVSGSSSSKRASVTVLVTVMKPPK